ncbi:MAG: hypothetical protein GZ093_11350 [Rhodoferax sp.]|uniref:hypothetical protein n=1 Tax=Rhodoferax sp. TaxID=50421 RepID=UPI0013FFD067|nr:hypothetical protein [Rhodoferax sp.]NDP39329.1 hypothetical protein [Rhodoferax sp.]
MAEVVDPNSHKKAISRWRILLTPKTSQAANCPPLPAKVLALSHGRRAPLGSMSETLKRELQKSKPDGGPISRHATGKRDGKISS